MEFEDVAQFLYGLPTEEFTAQRDSKAAEARGAGDRELADAVKRLRRPSAGAWLVNILIRDRRELVQNLVDLGAEMRRAQESLAGADLRRLSQKRREIVDSLTSEATRAASTRGVRPGAPAVQELTETLESVVADPEAADSVMSGRLVAPLRYSGFGPSVAGATGSSVAARTERSKSSAKRGPSAGSKGEGPATKVEDGSAEAESTRKESQREVEAMRKSLEKEVDVRRKVLKDAQNALEQSRGQLRATEDMIRELREQVRSGQRSVKDADRLLAAAERKLRQESTDGIERRRGGK